MTRFLITLDEAIDLIEWSYESPDSHGKIIVPKLQSMKIIDFGRKSYMSFFYSFDKPNTAVWEK